LDTPSRRFFGRIIFICLHRTFIPFLVVFLDMKNNHEQIDTVEETEAAPVSERVRDSFLQRAKDFFVRTGTALNSKKAWGLRGASLVVPGSGRVLGAGLAARKTWNYYDAAPRELTEEEKGRTVTRWMDKFHGLAHRNKIVRLGATVAVAALGILIGYGLLEASGIISADVAHAATLPDVDHSGSGAGVETEAPPVTEDTPDTDTEVPETTEMQPAPEASATTPSAEDYETAKLNLQNMAHPIGTEGADTDAMPDEASPDASVEAPDEIPEEVPEEVPEDAPDAESTGSGLQAAAEDRGVPLTPDQADEALQQGGFKKDDATWEVWEHNEKPDKFYVTPVDASHPLTETAPDFDAPDAAEAE
jgi:hypothetical protein